MCACVFLVEKSPVVLTPFMVNHFGIAVTSGKKKMFTFCETVRLATEEKLTRGKASVCGVSEY